LEAALPELRPGFAQEMKKQEITGHRFPEMIDYRYIIYIYGCGSIQINTFFLDEHPESRTAQVF
jgi:hypothetical protein